MMERAIPASTLFAALDPTNAPRVGRSLVDGQEAYLVILKREGFVKLESRTARDAFFEDVEVEFDLSGCTQVPDITGQLRTIQLRIHVEGEKDPVPYNNLARTRELIFPPAES